MRFVFILFLFIYGCNGNDGGSKNKAKISSGDIASAEAAKAFIQNSNNELKVSHQIKNDELDLWVKEGLISEAEAKEIRENTTPAQAEEL